MASVATAHEAGHRWGLSYFMLDRGMASIAFDLPFGDVPLMQEFRGKGNVAKLVFFVTFQAFVLRNVAIAFVDARVAVETVHPSVHISFMVEAGTPDKNLPFRLNVT
jgi:hypothetical protein